FGAKRTSRERRERADLNKMTPRGIGGAILLRGATMPFCGICACRGNFDWNAPLHRPPWARGDRGAATTRRPRGLRAPPVRASAVKREAEEDWGKEKWR